METTEMDPPSSIVRTMAVFWNEAEAEARRGRRARAARRGRSISRGDERRPRKGEEDGKMVKVEGKKEQELAERKVERDRRQGGL